jgi:hypothetical protein
MKGIRTLVAVLIVLGLCALTAGTALADPVGPYDVSFVTMRYDYPSPGYSTWYYTVSSTEGNAISHLVFELGACCNVEDAGLWVDFTTLTSWWGTSMVDVTEDPTTGVFGIKFDEGFGEGETRNYYFTVVGNHALAPDKITVAIKTGGLDGGLLMSSLTTTLGDSGDKTVSASIWGPDLECEETTAVALSSFSATSPSGPSAASLVIPIALLGVLVMAPASIVLAGRRQRL